MTRGEALRQIHREDGWLLFHSAEPYEDGAVVTLPPEPWNDIAETTVRVLGEATETQIEDHTQRFLALIPDAVEIRRKLRFYRVQILD